MMLCVDKVTPQKSNIDTKNGDILKESPFPNHRFGVSMLVFGDVFPLNMAVIDFWGVKPKSSFL